LIGRKLSSISMSHRGEVHRALRSEPSHVIASARSGSHCGWDGA
jgi:hypothetical protein